ncbi:CAP domain-containing protein [Actinokineospora sp.]|uniref:CAP domain-containing protein n=1 Tax=Actinokineospora sp. TaxID=1872133 RepID=UPI004037A03A
MSHSSHRGWLVAAGLSALLLTAAVAVPALRDPGPPPASSTAQNRTIAAPTSTATAIPTATTTTSGTTTTGSTTITTTTTTTTATTTSTATSTATRTKTTGPTTAPPPATPASPETAVLALVNRERAAAGCPALRWDDRIGSAARAHSVDMATRNYYSHTSLDGRGPADRMRAQGYPKPGGENIGAGYRTAEAAVKGWMDSSGHRANILDCRYRALGVGVGRGGKWGVYWTQNFGF